MIKQLLHMLLIELKGKETDNGVGLTIREEDTKEHSGVTDGGVSLHDLSSKASPNAFYIRGVVGKRSISFLIDSSSTNCFVDEALVRELKLPTIEIQPLAAIITNEAKMLSTLKCEKF